MRVLSPINSKPASGVPESRWGAFSFAVPLYESAILDDVVSGFPRAALWMKKTKR
jgi:hypothetical protein